MVHMPHASAPDDLVKFHRFRLDTPVNSACFTTDEGRAVVALGDGTLHMFGLNAPETDRAVIKAHSGSIPRILPYGPAHVLSVSDDGTLALTGTDGSTRIVANFKGAWVERVAVHAASGQVAVAVDKTIHHWTKLENAPRVLGPHAGPVHDLCFMARGQNLAAAHRDGVTLWSWPHFEPQSQFLAWKGAHLAITSSADQRWVVTGTQDSTLHVWNVATKRDYQMRGYWNKPTALAWSADGRWLGTSGSETLVIWPFDKAGPDGREPITMGWSNSTFVTQVAAHPHLPIMAAGFEDGAVQLLDIYNKRTLPLEPARGHAITALTFARDHDALLIGAEDGFVSIVRLPAG